MTIYQEQIRVLKSNKKFLMKNIHKQLDEIEIIIHEIGFLEGKIVQDKINKTEE